jgi:hypothetical protein
MKQSSKLAILGLGLQIVLGGLAVGLLQTVGTTSAETARRVLTAAGWVMGGLGALFLVWWFLARRAGR